MNLIFKQSCAAAIIGLVLVMLFAGCTGAPSSIDRAAFHQYEKSHFGFFRAYRSYPFVSELGVHWERPHPGPFIWGEIERSEGGGYDWGPVDSYVKEAQKHGVLLVATIWPYANWDQTKCHEKLPDARRLFPVLGDYRGKPCDTQAYRRFVNAMVDRYGGDGDESMPGLIYPIKYWEVSNEPDTESGSLFFKGDPQTGDYLELLQETHDAIEEIDPDAKVLNGGIAYLSDQQQPFWENILSGRGADDIDVLSIHSITLGNDLQLIALNDLMNRLNIDKPVWLTEIQFAKSQRFRQGMWQQNIPATTPAEAAQGMPSTADTGIPPAPIPGEYPQRLQDLNQDQWSVVLVRTFVEAFGRGASKLFYIGLDNGTPTEESSLLVSCRPLPGARPADAYDPALCEKQKPFFAYKTLVDNTDYYDSVDKLAVGQYRFNIGGRAVYVLWGSGGVPVEVKGRVKVTDIFGSQRELNASEVVLTEVPVYIEPA